MLRRFLECLGGCLTIGGLTLAGLAIIKGKAMVPYAVAFGLPFWLFIVIAYFIKDYRPVEGSLVTAKGKRETLYILFTFTRGYLGLMVPVLTVMSLAALGGEESPYLVGYLFILVSINYFNMGRIKKEMANGRTI